MFNPMGMDRSFDLPYKPERDLLVITRLLVLLGLRPHRLVRKDNNQRQIVWAESEERVRDYAPGHITPLIMQEGMSVDTTDVIVLPKDDGGYINVSGKKIYPAV